MYQLNERVSALFNKTKNCTLSTNGEYPNTIVIMFKEINAQGEILLCDVFMNKTLANLEKDAHVSVVVYEGLEGYQIKGTARWTDDDDLVAAGNAKTSQFGLMTKGVVIVTPESAEVLTPGPEVGKSL